MNLHKSGDIVTMLCVLKPCFGTPKNSSFAADSDLDLEGHDSLS